MVRALFALALMVTPVAAWAQAEQCRVPDILPRPALDLPDESQPKRVLPVAGYTLALTWSPQFCRGRTGQKDAFQCSGKNGRFGFSLHGLWPDGYRKEWPQYCRPAALLPRTIIHKHICMTPSVQLLQHEWAKHGTCMARTPDAYFNRASSLYAKVQYPDMLALSRRRGLNAGDVATAMAAANPGLRPDMMRISADRDGWLKEVLLCLDRRFRYARCLPHQRGMPRAAPVKIWRGALRR